MEVSILSVLGTGMLLMLAVGSIIILVHSFTGTDTKRRLTRLEDRQAKLEDRQAKLEDGLVKLEDGQVKLEDGQARLAVDIKEIKDFLFKIHGNLS